MGVKLKPPAHLAEGAQEVWREVTNALPANWFAGETRGLLEAYCVSLALLRKINRQTEIFSAQYFDGQSVAGLENTIVLLQDIERLRALAAKEASTLANLATKMRLTQQSRQSNEKGVRGGQRTARAPWEAT